MASWEEAGEIVRRALAYPYEAPPSSFLQVGGRAEQLPAAGPDLAGRVPLLAYGSNASPRALARKLAPLADLPLPLLRAELDDHDVVYSAHVSPYGAVPATLLASPGISVSTFVAYPTAEQLELLCASEPNYLLRRLEGLRCRVEGAPEPPAIRAFLSRHGELEIDGAAIALAAVEASGRRLAALEEAQVLEHVRTLLDPELSLESFVLRCVESGGLAILDPDG